MMLPRSDCAQNLCCGYQTRPAYVLGSKRFPWEVGRQVLPAMLLQFQQKSGSISQLSRVNDRCAIRARDRNRATLFTGVYLDDVFPLNALISSQPKRLLD